MKLRSCATNLFMSPEENNRQSKNNCVVDHLVYLRVTSIEKNLENLLAVDSREGMELKLTGQTM